MRVAFCLLTKWAHLTFCMPCVTVTVYSSTLIWDGVSLNVCIRLNSPGWDIVIRRQPPQVTATTGSPMDWGPDLLPDICLMWWNLKHLNDQICVSFALHSRKTNYDFEKWYHWVAQQLCPTCYGTLSNQSSPWTSKNEFQSHYGIKPPTRPLWMRSDDMLDSGNLLLGLVTVLHL